MLLYYEVLGVRIYISLENEKVLYDLRDFWKGYADRCEIHMSRGEKVDCYIQCYSDSEKDDFIEYDDHAELYYKSNYDFLVICSLLRELTIKLSVQKGVLWLHASSFSVNGEVVVVIGTKGGGKTTSLCLASKYLNAKFICNDQLPLLMSEGKVYTQKWRPDIKITNDTLKMVNEELWGEADRWMLFEKEKNYNLFDFNGIYQLTGQDVKALSNGVSWDFRYEDNSLKSIKRIVLLNDENDCFNITSINNVLDDIKADRECIIPSKAIRWNENFDYWNKHYTKLNISTEQLDNEVKLFKYINQEIETLMVNNKKMKKEELMDVFTGKYKG